jgi:hypothetical protein
MAQFCVKCGAPMGDGMQFCTSCGATVGAPPAPAAPAPSVGETTLAPSPAAPPLAPIPVVPVGAPGAKKGSPVVKILLIVVAVIIFFMVLVGASCAYMFYRAKQKVSQFEKQAESSFPVRTTPEVPTQPGAQPDNSGGGMTPGAGAPVSLGDLAYPGAAVGESRNQSLFGAATIKIQEYSTGDSVDTVVAYYRNKLSSANVSENNGSAVVTVGGTGGITTITIAPDTASGKTKITVSSFGKQ